MDTNQNDSQFGQGSRIDDTQRQNSSRYYGTEESTNNGNSNRTSDADNDDDFLAGDNAPKDPQNPNRGNNEKSLSPGRDNNSNIGGNENEYDNTKHDEDGSNPTSEDNFQSAEDSNQERRSADTYLNTDIDTTKNL